jgi:hypothetical protein
MPSTIAAISSTERMPPRLSTGSVVSLTWAGTKRHAMNSATNARGSVTKKTDPHANWVSSAPASSGPSEEIAPPMPDHSAIERVRAGPDHSAVISARVVGYAMPAESPPSRRAASSTPIDGASAASRLAGIESPMPSSSISLRP